MSSVQAVQTLRGVSFFAHRTDAELRRLARYVDEACVPAGTLLAQQGLLCHEFVIIADGVLETCRSGRPGRLGAHESFGWDAMRTRGLNDATVRTVTAARLLVMSHQQFQAATSPV